MAAERAGRPGAAAAALAGCLAPEAGAALSSSHLLLPTLVRCALAAGDAGTAAVAARVAADAARDVADEATRAFSGEAGWTAGDDEGRATGGDAAAAAHCRGLLAADPAPVLAAAAYHAWAGRPLLRAQALTDAAVLLAGQGELAPARERFDEALGLYRGLGARWAVRAAAARLRGYGIRPRRPGHRADAPPGQPALTPAEAEIARLIAAGRSNPEIAAELSLSRNTVQTHVSHILAKLGARSRMEIAAAAVGERQPPRRDLSLPPPLAGPPSRPPGPGRPSPGEAGPLAPPTHRESPGGPLPCLITARSVSVLRRGPDRLAVGGAGLSGGHPVPVIAARRRRPAGRGPAGSCRGCAGRPGPQPC